MEDLSMVAVALSIVSGLATSSVFAVIKLFLGAGKSRFQDYKDVLKAADRAKSVGADLPSMLLAYSSLETLLDEVVDLHESSLTKKLQRAEELGLLDALSIQDFRRLANIRNLIAHGYQEKDSRKSISDIKVDKYLSDIHRFVEHIELSRAVLK